MGMNGCIGGTLAGLLFILVVNGVGAQDTDEQLLDSLTSDNSLKSKRPFCNAFTGCGKKRSFHDNSVEHQDSSERTTIRMPIALYRALIRVATREIRNSIERASNVEDLPSTDRIMGQDYFSFPSIRKLPVDKRYDG